MSITFKSILLTTLIFVFTACTPENLVPKTLTTIKETIMPSTIKEVNTPNIEGTFNLVEGTYKYNSDGLSFKHKIQASSIVIERLSENEFGYYYVTKLDGLTTNSYFGGFLFKEGKFFQKVVDDSTHKTSLVDNIRLTKFRETLRLTIKTANAKRDIFWKRSEEVDSSIATELEEEKKAYLSFYKNKI
jgi:hypothetical protein